MGAVWEISGSTLVRYTGDDREIVIPDGISEIAGNAFCRNKRITSVIIPNRINTIGYRAFYKCTALQTVKISDVHIIAPYAFAGCTSLRDVSLPDNTMVSITYGAFKGCTSLKAFKVPKGVRKISPGAFCKCQCLEKVSLPSTLKRIREYAFSKCTRLKEVYLASVHTDISPAAFHKCNADIFFEWETKAANPCAARDGFDIDSTGTLVSYFGRKPEIRIPDGVTAAGRLCFEVNTSVKAIIAPASLKNLKKDALAWTSAEHVCLTGVEIMEDGAFWASNIRSIDLPESLVSVGKDAFLHCRYLKKLEFKNPGLVFKGRIAPMAYSLETVVLPEGLKEIPDGAFYYCESLRDIRIPGTVEHIADGAFQGCRSLHEITIPESVKTLDWNVFNCCDSLTEVILLAEETVITGKSNRFCAASVRHANQPRAKNTADKFEVRVLPIRRCERYNKAEYKMAFIRFDIVKDGKPFDDSYNGLYECTLEGLEGLVKAANDFLAGKFTKDVCLWFDIPYVIGQYTGYQYFFDIHVGEKPEDNYWVFKLAQGFITAEKRGIIYTCTLKRNQVSELAQCVAGQIEEFDWDSCGKTEFFTISEPDKPYEWCYSAKKLEEMLNTVLAGDRLKAIYVHDEDFIDPLSVEDGYWNCYGPRLYLEFEKTFADILAHAEGMFEIRLFDSAEVSKERFFEEWNNQAGVYCDIGYIFHLNDAGETVRQIKVDATSHWMWNVEGFDQSKVSDPVELPKAIRFIFDNQNLLTLTGEIDDFSISLEQAEE